MQRWISTLCICAVGSLAGADVAQAASISFNGATSGDTGTGFGNVLQVLTLQDEQPNADGLEAGSVVWDGSQDVYGTVGGGIDTKPAQSFTRTVDELTAKGVDGNNFAVIFNLNQQGANDAVSLHDFYLRFQDQFGATLFDAKFDSTDNSNSSTSNLTPAGQGVGTSGYLFPVTFTQPQISQFFGDTTNRVGLYVNAADAIEFANDGPETFFIGPIPEPAAIGSLAVLLGFACRPLRRGGRRH